MYTRAIGIFTLLLVVLTASATAQTELFDRFRDYHSEMGSDLTTKPSAELATVTDFVYQKDVATFTFISGKLYLLRFLDGRPTTAIFIGQGKASISIPSGAERNSLLYASGKATVEETFAECFINFSDDLDLKLKERFQFERTVLSFSEQNKVKRSEFFFHPKVYHEYDNYFQLIRSHLNRAEDGYFWIDFNRYNFTFDPNRPEHVVVDYEHEGGDMEMVTGVQMQRQERARYGDYELSDIAYPTRLLSRTGTVRLKGLDGKYIDRAAIDVTLEVLADSLNALSLFLHYNLRIDSLRCSAQPVSFDRRKDFSFCGVLLSSPVHRGDTVTLTVFYHGKDYNTALPYVENTAASVQDLVFEVPSGYDLLTAGAEQVESSERGMDRFLVQPAELYHTFHFQPYASGYDTLETVSNIGFMFNILKSGHITKNNYENYVADNIYDPIVTDAFNWMTSRLGPPPGTFVEWVFPDSGASRTMPGLISVPQVQELIDGTGGLQLVAGNATARQWFGSLMQPKTDREYWLMDAPAEYLGLMYVSSSVSPSVFFGELLLRRDFLRTVIQNNEDWPLSAGRRVPAVIRAFKGAWVIHMLRYLMYDLETHSERTFQRFLNELRTLSTSQAYSNEDIVKLAEKHYGAPLDWFFKFWLFDRNYPEYGVQYAFEQRADGYYVVTDVTVQKAPEDFRMPVVVRIEDVNGQSSYHRPMISGVSSHFELGPLQTEPKEMIFNEFASVLSKDDVKKK